MLQEAKEKAARTKDTEAKFRAEVRVEELRPKLKVNPYLKRMKEEDTLAKRFEELTRTSGKKQACSWLVRSLTGKESVESLKQRSEEEAFQRKSEGKKNKKRKRGQKKQEKAPPGNAELEPIIGAEVIAACSRLMARKRKNMMYS